MLQPFDDWEVPMDKYICDVCGYIYDPEVGDPDGGIAPGTAFEDIPDDWVCPVCGVGKDDFSLYEGKPTAKPIAHSNCKGVPLGRPFPFFLPFFLRPLN